MKGLLLRLLALLLLSAKIQSNTSENKQKGKQKKQTNTINESKTNPYKRKDELIKRLRIKWRDIDAAELEKICIKSDGDLSEGLSDDLTTIFYQNPNSFISFLLTHPKSCLKAYLIEGLSSQFSVYKKNQRYAMIKKDEKWMLKKADSLLLAPQKKDYIKYLYKTINPSILD